jgi:nitrate/TMAO reductase-like tetraheme cytochrome c subunit
MKFYERVRNFLLPPPGSPRWLFLLPIVVVLTAGLLLFSGGVTAWEYSNSNQFCGTVCHSMPPQYTVFLRSPHSNVTCEECHIGRTSFFKTITRKSRGLLEVYAEVTGQYEFPLFAHALRPAVDTCEKCHRPETFSDDSLRRIEHFGNTMQNPATITHLILKTGGGTEREGLGRGIHWHIENPVYYYSPEEFDQEIPYIRVINADGSYAEYVDVESNFNVPDLDESRLKRMDCITCHNRVTHDFKNPARSVDESMGRGLISPEIPGIRLRAIDVLSAAYETREDAMKAIEALEEDYKRTGYYPGHGDQIRAAIEEIKAIYDRTVFHDQKIDWTTHPNNLGHIDSPGCFRCHDGKHLNELDQAVRLECNLCHSIPVVSDQDDFVTTIEINNGPEPESHLNANWISLHNQSIDFTCSNCHTTNDMGGTSNTSFCSNSACHGTVFTFAGFDAPRLREILQAQIPPPAATPPPPPLPANPTFENYVSWLFQVNCVQCHGPSPSADLSFLIYQDAMRGGENGPVILPGNSANSPLVVVQRGDHFKNFTSEELDIIIRWIDAGAPER